MGTARFLRHEACPKCGSKDNVSVYWSERFSTETWWCETDGCDNRLTEADITRQRQAITIDADPLNESDLEKMGYTQIIATTYDIRRRGMKVFFVYYDGGIPIEAKVRDYAIPKNEDFHFTWLAKAPKKPLYGMQTCNPKKRKALIICEGEKDAPASRQMKGYDAVSVPTGAKGALSSIKAWFHWIDQYEFIYLCFDNDEEGNRAAQECADYIGFKAAIVRLPKFVTHRGETKDAYDYLASGLVSEFCNAIGIAVTETPTYILSHDKFVGRLTTFLLDPTRRKGYSTGIELLDEIIGGFRLGEVSTMLASPGRGKSSFGRFILTSLMKQDAKGLYISLEEQPEIALGRLLGLVTGFDIIHEGDTLTPQQIAELAEHIRDKVVMADLSGSLNLELLEKLVYYGVKQHDVKFILLDHITAAVNADEMVWKSISQMMDALNQLAQKHTIHICVISHTNRKSRTDQSRSKRDKNDDNDDGLEDIQDDPIPSISDAFGSSGIEQYTHLQLGIRRVDSLGVVKIHVLKNRLWGDLGVVTTEYREGNYVATKVHKFTRNNRRDKVRKQDGSSTVCEVPTSGVSSERVDIRALLPSADTDDQRSVSGEHEGTTATAQNTEAHTGLPVTERVDSRDEGSDGRGLPPEGTTLEGTTSECLQSLPNSIWESRPNHPKAKAGLRRLGRQSRSGVDTEQLHSSGLVCRTERISLDDFLGS